MILGVLKDFSDLSFKHQMTNASQSYRIYPEGKRNRNREVKAREGGVQTYRQLLTEDNPQGLERLNERASVASLTNNPQDLRRQMTEHFEGDAVLRQSQMLEEKIVNHPSQELDVTDDRGTEVSVGQNEP